jgi:hypothetical protein
MYYFFGYVVLCISLETSIGTTEDFGVFSTIAWILSQSYLVTTAPIKTFSQDTQDMLVFY